MIGLEQVVFLLLIVLALFVVFARNLKFAIISSGVFGLWASLTYLLYHAPDVAVAEAVVASSLGTVLFVLTIRHYRDITVPPIGRYLAKRLGIDLLLVCVAGLVLVLTARTPPVGTGLLQTTVMERYLAGPQVVNPVTSVLLNYRVLDTVFEALMLVIAVLGVVHLTDQRSRVGARGYHWLNAKHPTLRMAIGIMLPILMVTALALIVGDPLTPGGGFQGGGLLAAVVISRYLIRANDETGIEGLATLEKAIFLVFVASVAAYVLIGWREDLPLTYAPFMVAMNGLLGVKVFCGLALMFLYFASERETPSSGEEPRHD